MAKRDGWIGVDLDGTLAYYDGWKGADHIGLPILLMRQRVLDWLAAGQEVRIFTARVGRQEPAGAEHVARRYIEDWCAQHLGRKLKVTAEKDFAMVELWDDRAVRVESNSGVIL